jgi:hypothetical protein
MRRLSTPVCVGLLCCMLGLDDQSITLLVSPRVLLVCGLLFYLRFEWRAGQECVVVKTEDSATVKENYQLSQTVMNLSDQHKLLCDIRTSVLKSTKYSRDVLLELRFSACDRSSPVLSRRGSVSSSMSSSPNAMPDADEDIDVSPLVRPFSSSFRRGAVGSLSKGMPEADEESRISPLILPTDSVSRAKAAFRRGEMSESC